MKLIWFDSLSWFPAFSLQVLVIFEYALKQYSADVAVTNGVVTSPVESTVEVVEYSNTAHLDDILVNQIQ